MPLSDPANPGERAVMAYLRVTSGPGAGGWVALDRSQPTEIGRGLAADLSIPGDSALSRRHFKVSWSDAGWEVEDLGSANSTYVGEQPVTRRILATGEAIVAGESEFVITETPPPETGRERVPPPEVRGHAPARTADAVRLAPEPAAAPAAQPRGALRILNRTPFAVALLPWEDEHGTARLTVIVKATFDMPDGGAAPVAAVQVPVFDGDRHYDGDPLRTVQFESDRVPFKPLADVVLVGAAYAPAGRPVDRLVAGLRVGDLARGVLVHGDREWLPVAGGLGGLRIGPSEPFVRMELVYERAFGGFDPASSTHYRFNLAGTGYLGRATLPAGTKVRLPNLEDPENPIRDWQTRPKPAGFGFFGRGWMPRLGYAGTFDDAYRKVRAPLPPTDFVYRFYNGAHPDLQVKGYLRGDETVSLVHLTPESRLDFGLSGLVPRVIVRRDGGAVLSGPHSADPPTGSARVQDGARPAADEEVAAKLDTLVLLPEERRFYQVFRGVTEIDSLESTGVAAIEVSCR